MKKLICLIIIIYLCFNQRLLAQELKYEFLFEMNVYLNPAQFVGPVLTGIRVISPVKEGFVKGEIINGKLLVSGGADWGLIVDSTTFKLDVRCTIQTDDGALIYMTYSGYIHSDAKKFAMIFSGKANEVSPSDYYFRTNPVFETSSPKYAWLNHTVAIGVGHIPVNGNIVYRIYVIK
jgi:hypothetical protein